jgi:hypothetical protein
MHFSSELRCCGILTGRPACYGTELLRLKSVEELCHYPTGPMSRKLADLMAQYLNVRQSKLGVITYHNTDSHIPQHDGAENFVKHNPNYFQITQPGSSTALPPVTLNCMLQSKGKTTHIKAMNR